MIEKQFVSKTLSRIKLKNYLKKILGKVGLVDLEVIKSPMATRIIIYVTRPGYAIGKGGKNIKILSDILKKEYGIENPQIEIEGVKDARLNARVVADKIKNMIEGGQNWRSVAFKAARDLKSANAQGFEIVLSGVLAGKGGRKRKHRIIEGYMKKVGDQTSKVDYAQAHAFTKPGAIGIKVRIIKPGISFPDKTNVKAIVEKYMEETTVKEIKEKKEIETAKKEIMEKHEEIKKKEEEKKTAEAKKTEKKVESKKDTKKAESKKEEKPKDTKKKEAEKK